MFMPSRKTSPLRTRANDSLIEAPPARSDLTSLPVRARPASKVSRISYSKLARLLRSSVAGSPDAIVRCGGVPWSFQVESDVARIDVDPEAGPLLPGRNCCQQGPEPLRVPAAPQQS